ncbi:MULTISPECIES: GNAT family N-acetyltransferase [unclassified Agarivorans]|uniref:GNAT family N-acetyltransferase n=1 Tax=unclassified Agarivorans TaxID=2636026 RepID=UPI0026E36137|nr:MULTISPECIES: GNAT family N-acetyltransferase [unclassified Agarivorans]MDO6686488.1 GNAT family N-acetyltransferase [Agarivorans sp. 3_MG-2023]MDO6715306.1 GNAT family N-acetyltransferase [Agarivorans sp. 2_MG-2023]MDO6763378.1 GNAT family N-acetyltransferase [Agarivorans sp. 1_MG-2023]
MSSPTLITANYSDIPALSEMFIAAYANNEAMQAALRSDEMADYAHDSYWRFALGEWGMKQGTVFTTADHEGCVIMVPPGKHQPDVLQKMEAWAIVARMMGAGKLELAKDISEQMLTGPVNQDCYWLWGLGVGPSAGGKGLAGALIKQVTDLADADNKACFVVASSEKVVLTFERRGFEVLSKSDNFPYWFMLRPAQA